MTKTEKTLLRLFKAWSGEQTTKIVPLAESGSDRKYYRIKGKRRWALGVYNPDKKENIAFLSFTKHFLKMGLHVPTVYIEDAENDCYLIQDLEDNTLFSYLSNIRKDDTFPEPLTNMYKKVIEKLPHFQIDASEKLDYKVCYPRASFDRQSMMWDMNYFKYYFLKLAGIPFDEQRLEDDFNQLCDYLLKADSHYFLYRDFQSRNIMIYNQTPYFIDYQGGRKGALQYDIASLLYDAKADIPQEIRSELLEHYVRVLSDFIPVNREEFISHYYGFVLIRIMQAMGAYGFRGFYEKKIHFLKSIPYAINNLKWLLENVSLPINTPTLNEALHKLTLSEKLKKFSNKKIEAYSLLLNINSFSYKQGIPNDDSGNGGGFVFDCRILPNPGRLEEYKTLTGKDKKVIAYFKDKDSVDDFLNTVYTLTEQAIDNYLERDFTHLMISFGCTGGQHRSVYCAEKLKKHVEEKYPIEIVLHHIEQEKKEKEIVKA